MPTKKEKTNRSIELSPEDGGSFTLSPAKAWFLGIGIDDYEGEGKSGQLLHSQATEADGTKLLYFPLTKGVWLEKGKKYTFNFEKFAYEVVQSWVPEVGVRGRYHITL